jgi:hypothetical protein
MSDGTADSTGKGESRVQINACELLGIMSSNSVLHRIQLGGGSHCIKEWRGMSTEQISVN